MLYTTDRDGQHRFGIYQGEDGRQQLEISDQSGNVRLFVGEDDEGCPMLYTTDRDGQHRFGIYQGEDGSQWLRINGRQID